MSDVTLDQVLHLAEQLSPQEQTALIQKLQSYLSRPGQGPVTREMLLAEHAQLVAQGAFENVTSLRNKYARPDLDPTFEEIDNTIREFSSEWEKELDEFYRND